MVLLDNLDPTKIGPDAAKLEANLRRLIVGQDDAIDEIAGSYQAYLAGMTNPGRPIGTFMFLGPTGSGKTRLVEAMAESLLDNPKAVVKIDCAEFQHSHEISKLIGSPPGYLGHRETHPALSQEALNHFHTDRIRLSFVLFDEIEKASDAVWNLLLGILDKATLTLGDNRRVDFSNAMIFMTSNLGAEEMSSILTPKLGFAASETRRNQVNGALDQSVTGKLTRAGAEAARRRFTPEFINRIDKIVVFKPLQAEELRKILDLELDMLQQRILNSVTGTPFIFAVSDKASTHLLREGTDVRYGARHLKRAIERLLVHPLSNLIATQQVCAGDSIIVDFDAVAQRLTFHRDIEKITTDVMLQMTDSGIRPESSLLATEVGASMHRVAGARSR